MASKTKILRLIKNFEWQEAQKGFDEHPALIDYRDDKGRNLLHLCCSVNLKKSKGLKAKDSIATATLLLDRGLDIDGAAFHRQDWQATPLWHAVSRGENFALAAALLKRGCDPEHCLWAAVFKDDVEMIKLLVGNGAKTDPIYQDDGTTPFLTAVKGGHFAAANTLLDLGAKIDYQDPQKRTALHWALKNGAEKQYVLNLLKRGARGDRKDADGRTAAAIMEKKKDPDFAKMSRQFFG